MTEQRRIALEVSYRGTELHGYQRQAGFPTVQEELEQAWFAVAGERVVMHGSGRTDAGVHALRQVVHFPTAGRLAATQIPPALNAYLPSEVVVRRAAEVDLDFHACASAISKRYLYRIALGRTRPVLVSEVATWVRATSLDVSAMRDAAQHLRGRHDFSAFAAAGGSSSTSVRSLRSIRIRPIREGLLFAFEADGFLYRMVRNLVGSLLEVGRGRWHSEWIAAVLEGKDRARAGPTAPPEGLCLWRVRYQKDPFFRLPLEDAQAYAKQGGALGRPSFPNHAN